MYVEREFWFSDDMVQPVDPCRHRNAAEKQVKPSGIKKYRAYAARRTNPRGACAAPIGSRLSWPMRQRLYRCPP